MIETDGVTMCVHYRCLKVDRPVPLVTKHEDEKEADPSTQKVQDNDFVVGADPGNMNIITNAAPKRAEGGIDGTLRQKDMRLFRFSRARCYLETGRMNARKKIEKWNAGMREHLEAVSDVTSHGADVQAFLKFMEVRIWRTGMRCGRSMPSPGGLVCE
jgi:hypothetical protein